MEEEVKSVSQVFFVYLGEEVFNIERGEVDQGVVELCRLVEGRNVSFVVEVLKQYVMIKWGYFQHREEGGAVNGIDGFVWGFGIGADGSPSDTIGFYHQVERGYLLCVFEQVFPPGQGGCERQFEDVEY